MDNVQGNTATQEIDNSIEESSEVDNQRPAQPAEAAPEAQRPAEQPEDYDYKKDKRWGKHWKSEQDMYKSIKEMDKWQNSVHRPLKEQFDKYNQHFKTYGIDANKLEDALKEYQSFKDPATPQNQWWNYLQSKMANKEISQKVMDFFTKLEQEELQNKYGANLPPELYEKLDSAEKIQQEFEAMKQAEQKRIASEENVKIINEQKELISKWAEENDVEFNDDVWKSLLDYAEKENISPKELQYRFAYFANKAVRESAKNKATQATLKNVADSKKAGMLPSNGSKTTGQPKVGREQMLDKMAERFMGLAR